MVGFRLVGIIVVYWEWSFILWTVGS